MEPCTLHFLCVKDIPPHILQYIAVFFFSFFDFAGMSLSLCTRKNNTANVAQFIQFPTKVPVNQMILVSIIARQKGRQEYGTQKHLKPQQGDLPDVSDASK